MHVTCYICLCSFHALSPNCLLDLIQHKFSHVTCLLCFTSLWQTKVLNLLCSVPSNSLHSLTVCQGRAQASAVDWFIKGRVMCYYVYVVTHVKDPQLSIIRMWHCVPLARFCLFLYSLCVLNRDVNIIQIEKRYHT